MQQFLVDFVIHFRQSLSGDETTWVRRLTWHNDPNYEQEGKLHTINGSEIDTECSLKKY
jgi:hypothetical protein